jgi:hypothetical protein
MGKMKWMPWDSNGTGTVSQASIFHLSGVVHSNSLISISLEPLCVYRRQYLSFALVMSGEDMQKMMFQNELIQSSQMLRANGHILRIYEAYQDLLG